MTFIRDDLRDAIFDARHDLVVWGKILTQRELHEMSGVSLVWIRQIETAVTVSASPNSLAAICYTLHINEQWLKDHHYDDVRDAVAAKRARERARRSSEYYLRLIPGLTLDEKEHLVTELHNYRRGELLAVSRRRS